MALDWSFEPDPKKKGSYYRRLKDISLALDKFEVNALPANSAAQFVAYYFGAEKLAKAIVGIVGRVAAEKAFEFVAVNPTKIKSAVEPMGLQISDAKIDALFLRDKDTKQPDTAIEIRNRLFHDFGPTQVCHVRKHAARLIPIMVRFIHDDIDPVLKHLRALWAASRNARP
jgi:hypothetical protein